MQHLSEKIPVSPGSAEALVRCGGKRKYILIAYFLGNICAKNCRNRTVYIKIIASCKGGTFFETHCIALGQCHGTSYQCRNISPYLPIVTNHENNPRRRSGLPPKFNHFFIGPINKFQWPTFPTNFMQIRSEVFAQSC